MKKPAKNPKQKPEQKTRKRNSKPSAKKENHLIRKFLISLPLVLCALWIISLILKQKLIYLPNIGLKLSPIRDNTPLIMGLVIFIAGYLLFLSILYFEDIKSFFKSPSKKKK
jgi:hypothetical protein|tara:strand:- start:842 stop:1177 length:336 start_codon:yes stop_codon:yes gene_type:complete